MAATDVTSERGTRLVEVLRQERDQGRPYPLSVERLRELAEPAATNEELLQVLAGRALAAAVVLADKKDPASPVALAEDADRLAGSPQLLGYVLGKLASAAKPVHPPARLAGKVDKRLRPAFMAALTHILESNLLPPGIGRIDIKGQPHLYLEHFPPPTPRKLPAVELSERLLAALEQRRQSGSLTVPLAELAGEAQPPLIKKAVAVEPYVSRAFLLPLTKSLTLAGLAADREEVLSGERLLLTLLELRTTARKPLASVADLASALPEEQRATFCNATGQRLSTATLPSGVAVHNEGGEPRLALETNLPLAVRLGEKILTGLARRRESGADYPAILSAVIRTEVPDAQPEQIEQLLADRTFKSKLLLAVPGQLDAPAVLAGDEARLAASPQLLTFAVGQLSTAEAPLHPLSKITALLDRTLRPLVEPAVRRHLEEGTLPSELAHHDIKGKPHLRLSRHPLPPPAEEALAAVLLATLTSARAAGDDRYPASLSSLVAATGQNPSEKVIKAALALPAFQTSVVAAFPGKSDSLIVLAGDAERLASDPRLLLSVLTSLSSADNQAVPAADLGKKLTGELREAFATQVQKRVETGTLPPGIGCLRIRKKPHLFLLDEVSRPQQWAPAPRPVERTALAPPAPTSDFARAFEEAFDRLDQERGSYNLVSLVRLRQAVPVSRADFDAGIEQLRQSGRYSLSGAEGRHGITPEEREAGIAEHGNLLLFVSRREPT